MWLDNASNIDLLFYSPYADTVVNFARTSELTPLTIGLYGSWGAGKSSLLQLIEAKFKSQDTKIIEYAVKTKYPQIEGFDNSSDYIEKLIQLPSKIPELSSKDIENYLLLLICQLQLKKVIEMTIMYVLLQSNLKNKFQVFKN